LKIEFNGSGQKSAQNKNPDALHRDFGILNNVGKLNIHHKYLTHVGYIITTDYCKASTKI
jgi:hypothetical protein